MTTTEIFQATASKMLAEAERERVAKLEDYERLRRMEADILGSLHSAMESEALLEILRDTTNDRTVRARCIAIVGEPS
jgi:hypothetical protein